jgi:hypothetical protein
MAARNFKKLVLTSKLETLYSTDATPLAANAMQVTNVTFTPLEAQEVSRDLMLPYLGNQGVVLAEQMGRMQFSVEVAGSGTAGTAPAFGTLLRSCGLAEVVTAGTSVVYSPISASFESSSNYWNHDGVNHVLLGCRGNVQLEFTPSKIPYLKYDIMGLLGTVADVALPTVNFSGFKKPLIVSKANTTLSLFGNSCIAESVSIDLGQKVEGRFLIGDESILITDRSSTGTAVIQAGSVASWDVMSAARNRTRGAFSLVHGLTAGNICTVAGPQVEIGKISQGQTQNIINYSLPLMFCPSTGNDELTIAFT